MNFLRHEKQHGMTRDITTSANEPNPLAFIISLMASEKDEMEGGGR